MSRTRNGRPRITSHNISARLSSPPFTAYNAIRENLTRPRSQIREPVAMGNVTPHFSSSPFQPHSQRRVFLHFFTHAPVRSCLPKFTNSGMALSLAFCLVLSLTRSVSSQEDQGNPCLTTETALEVGNNWIQICSNYSNALAEAAVAPDYVEWSTSINFLTDNCNDSGVPLPLNAQTFSSRAELMLGQSAQPSLALEQVEIWFTCKTVVMRFQMTPVGTTPIVAMLAAQTELAPVDNLYKHWMRIVYLEYDVAIWCQALGLSLTLDPQRSYVNEAGHWLCGSATEISGEGP